jgi:hypothetical protein
LVAIETDRFAKTRLAFVPTKDAGALRMKKAALTKIIHRSARSICRVQLDEWLRPESTASHLLVDKGSYSLITDTNEALNIPGIVVNDAVPEREDIHNEVSLHTGCPIG